MKQLFFFFYARLLAVTSWSPNGVVAFKSPCCCISICNQILFLPDARETREKGFMQQVKYFAHAPKETEGLSSFSMRVQT